MLTGAQADKAFNYGLKVPGLSPTHCFQVKQCCTSPTLWETSSWSWRTIGKKEKKRLCLLSSHLKSDILSSPFLKDYLKHTKFWNPRSSTPYKQTSNYYITVSDLRVKVSNMNTIQTRPLSRGNYLNKIQHDEAFFGYTLDHTMLEVGNCTFTNINSAAICYTK